MSKKVPVYDVSGKKVKDIELPEVFDQNYRADLVKRAFLAFMSHVRQPYGADPFAGKRTSADYRGRRRDYGAWVNRGLHRTKRIRIGSGHMYGVARFVPHAVKGRKAHAPKAEKIWEQKINIKERIKALISAIAGTSNELLVEKRGHVLPENVVLPYVVSDAADELSKTKEVKAMLEALGLSKELERTSEIKIRAGKGKMRGRKYAKKVGPLIVTANKNSKLLKAAENIPGVNVVYYDHLNIKQLAPSGQNPRLVIYTESAVQKLAEKYGKYVY